MESNSLTDRQTTILRSIFRYWQEHRRPPTLAELTAQHGFRDHSTVVDHLKALERKGYIRRQPGTSRGIQFQRPTWEMFGIPILGRIPAGTPTSEAEFLGPLMPDDFYPRAEGLFALQVSGRSMVLAGILPGDLVLVHKHTRPHPGDIVVAQTDDFHGDATVKRLAKRDGELWLDPESDDPSFQPIALNGGEILGTVVQVQRRLKSLG